MFMAVYGSWPRNEATVDSDIDIAVIADPSADHEADRATARISGR